MDSGVVCMMTTCPSEEVARRIAGALVEQHLAACVQRIAPIASTYRWQGAVEESIEQLVLVKTSRERIEDVQRAIRELHPYELPEIVVLPVSAGFGPYLRWVIEETRERPTGLA